MGKKTSEKKNCSNDENYGFYIASNHPRDMTPTPHVRNLDSIGEMPIIPHKTKGTQYNPKISRTRDNVLRWDPD